MSIFAWSLTSGLSGRRKDNSSEQALVNPFPFRLLTSAVCPFRSPTRLVPGEAHSVPTSAQARVWSAGFQCNPEGDNQLKAPARYTNLRVPAAKPLSDIWGIRKKRTWCDPVADKTEPRQASCILQMCNEVNGEHCWFFVS